MDKHFKIVNKSSDTAIIQIIGEIGWWTTSGERFILLVDELISKGFVNIICYINTPGGSMWDANEIGNQIMRFTGTKTCNLGALCASAGTLLSTYFDEINAASNISYMIHDPALSMHATKVEDFDSSKKLYLNLQKDAIKRYAKLTSIEEDDIREMMRVTTWMDAEELLEKGFIHAIIDEDSTLPDDAQQVLNALGINLPKAVLKIMITPPPKKKKQVTNIDTKIKTKMKLKIIALLAALGISNVNSESSEGDVNTTLQGFFDNVKNSLDSLATLLNVQNLSISNIADEVKNALSAKDKELDKLKADMLVINDAKLKSVLDIAENDQQKIDKKLREKFAKMAKDVGVDAVIDIVASLPARKKLVDGLEDPTDGADAVLAGAKNMTEMVYARISKIQADRA